MNYFEFSTGRNINMDLSLTFERSAAMRKRLNNSFKDKGLSAVIKNKPVRIK